MPVVAGWTERFWSYVVQQPGCWRWSGGHGKNGRPQFKLKGKSVTAARLMWILVHGEIPPKHMVCHTCDNVWCLQPGHLFLGTAKKNVADMIQKGRGREQKKTHCPAQHPYDEVNTYIDKCGSRHCRVCDRSRQRQRRQVLACR